MKRNVQSTAVSEKSKKPGESFFNRIKLRLRTKLITIFIVVKVVPIILLLVLAAFQFVALGDSLRDIAVGDSTAALNESAVENIERMSTDTAQKTANFLYGRDADILYLASLAPNADTYRAFINSKTGRVVKQSEWVLAPDGASWIQKNTVAKSADDSGNRSTNSQNNDNDGFHYTPPEAFEYINVPLYDEIAYFNLSGQEEYRVAAENSPKKYYPVRAADNKQNISGKNGYGT
jgi:hypothetical protein